MAELVDTSGQRKKKQSIARNVKSRVQAIHNEAEPTYEEFFGLPPTNIHRTLDIRKRQQMGQKKTWEELEKERIQEQETRKKVEEEQAQRRLEKASEETFKDNPLYKFMNTVLPDWESFEIMYGVLSGNPSKVINGIRRKLTQDERRSTQTTANYDKLIAQLNEFDNRLSKEREERLYKPTVKPRYPRKKKTK